MIDSDAIDTLLKAVRHTPTIVTGTNGLKPYAVVPEGFKVQAIDELRTTQDRIRQGVSVLTAEAFVSYWKRFSNEHSVIFADERTGTYTAIIDYHTAKREPAWCSHVATFVAQPSLEWNTWMELNGKPQSQPDFAQFIEDNYVDILKPSHGDMLAVATNLTAKKSVDFASGIRLQDGQTQLTYQEKITGSAETKQGSLKIPEIFTIGIPVLLGSPRVVIEARFRYRIPDGKLSIWYALHRPTQVREAAIRDATVAIRKELPTAPFFLGAAK